MSTQETSDPRIETEAMIMELMPEIATNVTFDGWTERSICDAFEGRGHDPALYARLFPGGLADVLDAFARWADQETLARIEADRERFDALKVREKIRFGVLTRLEVLQPYRDAVRRSMALLARPTLARLATKAVWRTADELWVAAGDTATDFNHYSKRTLLSAVLTSTTLYWTNDDSEGLSRTQAFLDRRIAEVLVVGGRLGKISGPLGRAGEAPFRLAGRLRDRVPFARRRSGADA